MLETRSQAVERYKRKAAWKIHGSSEGWREEEYSRSLGGEGLHEMKGGNPLRPTLEGAARRGGRIWCFTVHIDVCTDYTHVLHHAAEGWVCRIQHNSLSYCDTKAFPFSSWPLGKTDTWGLYILHNICLSIFIYWFDSSNPEQAAGTPCTKDTGPSSVLISVTPHPKLKTCGWNLMFGWLISPCIGCEFE